MGRYVIDRVFAEGAQGRLYRAKDLITNQTCILKTGESVKREALLALELNHPYIARPFDYGIDPEIGAYAAYPEYSDPSLLEWKEKRAKKDDLRRVALQIAEFLAFLHHRGWLYNDFKPGHFLISDQSIRVLDLGLCTRMDESSSTFFGTFPYIAPERLAGRPCDARSDIFALGMMLLHALLPHERWEYEPSLTILQEIPNRASQLSGFWRGLISEMTSFEVSQRLESGEELWMRLLPSSNRSFLFFPITAYFSIPDDVFYKEKVVVVNSPSAIGLAEAESLALRFFWMNDLPTKVFDFRNRDVEDCFHALFHSYSGTRAGDFFSAVERIHKERLNKHELIVFRSSETLNSHQSSLLSYAISSTSKNPSMHFMLSASREKWDLGGEGIKRLEIPLLTKESTSVILGSLFPQNGNGREKIKKIQTKSFSLPEQVIAEVRKELPQDQSTLWPAAAIHPLLPSSVEGLRPVEMRALSCFAISSSSLSKNVICEALNLSDAKCDEILSALVTRGYVQRQQKEDYFLTVSPKIVLGRIRHDRARNIASALLPTLNNSHGQETCYRVARIAGEKRLAAAIALSIGRKSDIDSKFDAAQEWFWRAFFSGAKLSGKKSLSLAKFFLRRAEFKKANRLLIYTHNRFGSSFALFDLFFDLSNRSGDFGKGEKIATKAAAIAIKKNKIKTHYYFIALLAYSYIRQQRLSEAEKTLDLIPEIDSSVFGLKQHFLGLTYFYRGNITDSLNATRLATTMKHRQRPSSYANLGVIFGRMGQHEDGRRCLQKAIHSFSKQSDSDKLSYAFNNLGLIFKQGGDIQLARQSFHKALQLCRANRNRQLAVPILGNIGLTYQLEGRTQRAINYYKLQAKIARKLGLLVHLGTALNDTGYLYSVQGKLSKALESLNEAARIRESLGLKADLASSYEFIGLTYLFSKHYRAAQQYIGQSSKLFEQTGCVAEHIRAQLYFGLVHGEKGEIDAMRNAIPDCTNLNRDSFEYGLFRYVSSMLEMLSNNIKHEIWRESLHQAERIFRKLPALFWLGKLLLLRADYFYKTDHYEKANISFEMAYNIFSKIGARKEMVNLSKGKANLKVGEDFLNRMAERLPYKILLMIKDVLSEPDPDKMITKILSASLEFTDMERAVLILNDDPPRIFKSASLEESAIKEIYEISNSAMDEATDTKKPYVRLDADSDPYLKSKPSILASRIMSIVCLPLRANDRPIGVLYLDSREGVETLASTETVLLEIFAAIISLALNNSLILERSLAENEDLRASLGLMQFPEIIGKSEPMMKVLKTVNQLLGTELPVLITGETGTGKEMIARVLHYSGKRKNGAFLAVNCSAITKSLLESELFGHEKGSFTGAMNQKKGLFEQARGGTLFLDEIGEMPYSMQAKLLRVLQEGEFRRVGGNETLHTDVRLVLATNRNLQEMVKQERFREDLFYRIKGAQVHLPALRERPQDIPLLVSAFLDAANKTSGRGIAGLTTEALDFLKAYSWPGNIRQLKNEVERVVALAQTDWIKPEDLDEEVRAPQKLEAPKKGTLRDRERQVIIESLDENKWNIVQTARTLGLTRNGLYGKMKLHGIPRKSVE